MHIDGRCHCGQVSYEAEIDPERVSICHCADCQVMSGSPYRVTVFANAADVKMTGADPKRYVKTAESGRKRVQAFCPECGTHIYATGTGEAAAVLGLRWGPIAQRAELTPKRQVWGRSAAPWAQDISDIPGTETA